MIRELLTRPEYPAKECLHRFFAGQKYGSPDVSPFRIGKTICELRKE